MYDPSLVLERTNDFNSVCNFLDLELKLENNTLSTTLYNKTDDYDFKILKYPNIKSNIHNSIANNTITGEIIRFSRCCSKTEDFKKRSKELRIRYLENGFSPTYVDKNITKTILKKKNIIIKYNLDSLDKIKTFINTLQ